MIRHSFVFAIALLSSACSLTQPAPLKQAYLLDPQIPARGTPIAQRGPVLRINRFVVAQPYDSKSFIYRLNDTRFEADYYNEFLAFPATMLTENTLRHLAGAGLYQAVVPMTSTLDAKLILEGAVTTLYGDFRSATPSAVLGIRFLLARDGSGEILYDKLIEKRVPVSARNATSLVTGFDVALGQVLAELATDLASANRP